MEERRMGERGGGKLSRWWDCVKTIVCCVSVVT